MTMPSNHTIGAAEKSVRLVLSENMQRITPVAQKLSD